jgi:tetratricopeptide (TPR) repeat protein
MNPQAAFLINQSMQSISARNFKAAELYLNQAVKLDPKNTHAHRFLGVVFAQQGQWEKALDSFKKSIKADPKNAIAYSNIGNVFLELKQYEEAIENYEKAISLNPRDGEVWSNKGNALAALKHYEEALTQYDKALALNPQYAEAWSNKGNSLSKLQRYEEALTEYDKALALNPQYAEAWSNKGNALNELKRYQQALLSYQQAISINSKHAETWSNAGNSLTELGQYEEALSAYDNAIKLDPNYAEALSNKGNLLSLHNQFEAAIDCCRQALEINQSYAPAWSNQAAYFTELLDFKIALSSANKALELDPSYAKAWLNKGSVLNYMAQYQDAIACFDSAIQLQPDYADAWANKGVALYELLQLDEAIQCCNKAIEFDPEHVDAHWNKSFSQLMLGNLDQGWINYEYRWRRKGADQNPHPHIPALTSLSTLAGKKILVWSEQGFGDTLQFARYIPKLIDLGAQVTFEVQEPLVQLFQNQYPCILATKGSPIEAADFQIPLVSLPLLFKTNSESIPTNIPYIKVAPEKIQEWGNRLPLSKEKLNIGIACSGNIDFDLKHGNRRPIPLAHFSELAQQHNLFLIQKDIRDSDQVTLQTLNTIHPLGHLINNFEDTAAIIENMDLIISIDTSLVHLAGALGKKALVLLSWSPDWRWLSEGATNPWYPTATLFRQPSAGDWESVMGKVGDAAHDIAFTRN